VNQIDLDAARAHGVAVCNVRNYGADAVAEHALMLMLALSRNLFAYRRAVLEGGWQQSAQFCLHAAPMKDLSARTLAVCGGGAIGEALAAKAAALGMRLMRVERKGAAQVRAGYTRFETALAEADVLSLHLPLNNDTRGLIGAAELALMKPDALLINTARGGLVDEAALLAALQAGRLGGAGLDVLDTEPPRQGNPLLDVELPNLIITPHAAWLSEQALAKLAQQLVDNIAAFLQGEPRNLVE
jgi:glycerate dehydrogenase